MRILEVVKCSPPHCPFRKYDDGGGYCDSWNYCSHPASNGKHITWDDLRSAENYDITYYDFPKWCPLTEEKKTSEEWQKECRVEIMDADGWDRKGNFHYSWYEEKITREEFEKRMCVSTCQFPDDAFKEGVSIWR